MTTHYELTACPACSAADTTTLASGEQIREEMEELWDFHVRRLRPGTPPERLADRLVFSQDPALRLGRCGACGLVFRNPREKERDLIARYAGEEQSSESLEGLFQSQRRAYRAQAKRLTRLAGSAGHGLEVGSYVGAFLSAAEELGWRFEGLDVNPTTTCATRARGFDVQQGTLADLSPSRTFDAVVIWNTFEQLADPRAAARLATERLKPDGLFAVRVPNGAFYAGLRRALHGPLHRPARALLAHNNLLGFPYRHGFTPSSLTRLLESTGLRVVLTVGDTLVPIADDWTRGWAAMEERWLKRTIRMLAPAATSPWFEMYARPVAS